MNDLCSHFATNFIFTYMELIKRYVQNTIKWNESQSIWGGTFPIPQTNWWVFGFIFCLFYSSLNATADFSVYAESVIKR